VFARDPDLEVRAAVDRAGDLDRAAVELDEVADEREADAAALVAA
jgi:hypothetical protein